MSKIGIGITTYKAPDRIIISAQTVPHNIDFVIVNDGTPYSQEVYPEHATIIQHETNGGVAKAKNSALKFLLDKGCDHIFLMEDDIIIKSEEVFEKYIKLSEVSGIKHFNFALHGPYNKRTKSNPIRELFQKKKGSFAKQIKFTEQLIASNERHELSQLTVPNPKFIFSYTSDSKLAVYKHCVGAFSYYHRSVIETVGLMDETFINAYEHLEHTYRIILKGFHPPFWNFADHFDSNNLLTEIPGSITDSVIAQDEHWSDRISSGARHFEELYGHPLIAIRSPAEEEVLAILEKMKK